MLFRLFSHLSINSASGEILSSVELLLFERTTIAELTFQAKEGAKSRKRECWVNN